MLATRAPAVPRAVGAAALALATALAIGHGATAAEPPPSPADKPNPAHAGPADPHAGKTTPAAAPGVGTQPPATPSARLHHEMMQGMTALRAIPMSGDVDRDFATMMAAHHQHGIRLAEEYVRSAGDPRLRRWAERMLAAQRKELEELRATGLVATPAPASAR